MSPADPRWPGCALSSAGTTWTTPVLPSEACVAPQVLGTRGPACGLVSARISSGTPGEDSGFYGGPFPHPSDGASTASILRIS